MTQLDDLSRDNVHTIIAYHAHCIDGFTSAWVAHNYLTSSINRKPEDILPLSVSYDTGKQLIAAALKQFKNVSQLIIVDFSLPMGDIYDLHGAHNHKLHITVLDHHKTALIEYLGREPEAGELTCNYTTPAISIHMDMEECGASLTWKYMHQRMHIAAPLHMPKLISYVQDYDLWKFKLPETKAINRYLRTIPKTFDAWSHVAHQLEDESGFKLAMLQGEAIEKYHASIVKDLVDQAESCNIQEYEGLCVNCSAQFSSDVGSELALMSGTYGATWQQEPGGNVKWSLRSTKDSGFDVSKVAELFGGGGHKSAAGFYLSTPQESIDRLGVTLWAD